jgi:hypothetical protein
MRTPSLRDRLNGSTTIEDLRSIWQEVEAARRDFMSNNTFGKCKKAYAERLKVAAVLAGSLGKKEEK